MKIWKFSFGLRYWRILWDNIDRAKGSFIQDNIWLKTIKKNCVFCLPSLSYHGSELIVAVLFEDLLVSCTQKHQ